MMTTTRLFTTAALLGSTLLGSTLSPALTAQEVVGITQATPVLMRQRMDTTCAPRRCLPAGFEKQVARHAGGTAYDSRIGGVWVTNGLQLANVDPRKGNCDYLCKPQKMPLPPAPTLRHYATGLAFCDSGDPKLKGGPGWLFASYNSGYIARIDVRRCSIKPSFCRIALPAGSTIAGLTTDDVNRRLFIGVVNANGSNLILVSDLDKNWCSPICKVVPPSCNSATRLGPLSGLAFDPCRQTLYITDGKTTTRYAVARPPQCQLRPLGCCPGVGDPFTGLAFLPNYDVHSVGKSCTRRACESCPTMRAELAGEPHLGNPNFGIALRNAPNKSSTAVLAVGVGACNAAGVNLGFCGNLHVAMPPILSFFPLAPIGPNGCNRDLTLPWQVPVNQNLCGLKVSFQWLVVCKGNPTGHGVTNCVDFTFAGS